MTLTIDFCSEFYAECSGQLGLEANYCDVHTGGTTDAFYAYPYVVDGEALKTYQVSRISCSCVFYLPSRKVGST